MEVDWSGLLSFGDGLDIVLLEQIEDVLSDFAVVEELSVHLGVLCLDQNAG